jgi:hypothetical protein
LNVAKRRSPKGRMRAAADKVPEYVEELMALPHTTGHGDACPNNLLAVAGSDDFTLIDFGFWQPMPVGADLGQLLIGDVQIGKAARRRPRRSRRRPPRGVRAGVTLSTDRAAIARFCLDRVESTA